ncbi:uncharacterized protein UHOD_07430 [Ustilago sp. UG-2017b]|nr:uncharacterized protein UHOD_07430 [Ustilago sp. UG-2017b]
MSLPLLARQTLLRGSHVTPAMLAVSLDVTSRLIHTQPNQPHPNAGPKRASWPLKTLGGGLVAAGSGWYYLGTTEARTFSVYSPLESNKPADGGKRVTGSSTLLRPASPAAPRRQTVTLVFLTSNTTSKGLVKSLMSNFGGGSGETEKWFQWIGYFREAGYDCLQMNLALPPSEATETTTYEGRDRTTAKLADELHTQIRMSNLQRQPVLFVHHAADASPEATSQIVSQYIEPGQAGKSGGGFWSKLFGGRSMFGGKPEISGLVVISDLDDASALMLFGKHPKLNTLIVANGGAGTAAHQGKVTVMDARSKNHEKVIKDIGRWLIKEGYEG